MALPRGVASQLQQGLDYSIAAKIGIVFIVMTFPNRVEVCSPGFMGTGDQKSGVPAQRPEQPRDAAARRPGESGRTRPAPPE